MPNEPQIRASSPSERVYNAVGRVTDAISPQLAALLDLVGLNPQQAFRNDVAQAEALRLARERLAKDGPTRQALAAQPVSYGVVQGPQKPRQLTNGFYSRLDEAASMLPAKGAKAQSVINLLKKAPGGVSEEELAYRKVPEWLASKGNATVTPEELAAHLQANPAPFPQVKTLTTSNYRVVPSLQLSDAQVAAYPRGQVPNYAVINDAGQPISFHDSLENARIAVHELPQMQIGDTKYGQYTLPGGEHYRETLLTLPVKKDLGFAVENQSVEGFPASFAVNFADKPRPGQNLTGYVNDFSSQVNARYNRPPNPSTPWKATFQNQQQWFSSPEQGVAWVKDQMRKIQDNIASYDSGFKSSHFDEPNILVHTRANDRTLPTGEKGRFLEEVQSDWHQQGKEKGYNNPKAVQAKLQALGEEWDSLVPATRSSENAAHAFARQRAITDEMNRLHDLGNYGVPDAPFKDTWPDLGLKQQLIEAARDPEAQWLGVTGGKTQAARYDLSKQISKIEWIENPSRADRGALIAYDHAGKPVIHESTSAEKLADFIGKDASKRLLAQPLNDGQRELSGLDLQVGGEGMRHFYDNVIPKRLEKIVKPFGGGVEPVGIPRVHEKWGDSFDAVKAQQNTIEPAWMARLTPEMKARILKEGLPLMALTGLAVSHQNPSDRAMSDIVRQLSTQEPSPR